MSNYVEKLKENANKTGTLNGAVTHASTSDACLDLFSVAGGMRFRSHYDQIALFDKAYIENPELAMKLLFYIRDIRGGLGEREMFRTLIRRVAIMWPESARKNVALISKYGRYDDLMCLMGTKAEREVVKLITAQLKKDKAALEERKKGNIDAPISLLAKWLPSINTSSSRTRGQAKVLCRALKMNSMEYRKLLSELRANICLAERYLTVEKLDKVNYEAVPAGAMLKYRNAFSRKDADRFDEYMSDVKLNKKKINSNTLFPYEILRPYFSDGYKCHADVDSLIELIWSKLDTEVGNENALCIVDTSGSMYWGKQIKPALISQALGIYYAERCKGFFHNHIMTFESEPHFMELKGNTLRDRLCYLQSAPCGYSTNMEAVFNLILSTAVHNQIAQDEMPSVLYIISDMEFNYAVSDPNKSVYENAKEKFEAAGYKLPAVVFHNVNSWQMQAPVTAYTKGTALVSGAGTASFKEKFDGNVTPMSHMLKVLGSKRYEEVHA